MYHKILIPTDGETHSEKAVKVALEFAKAIGAEALVAMVFQPLGAPDSTDLYNKVGLEKAQRTLANWELWGKQHATEVHTRLLEDDHIAAALIELAQNTSSDLIAMGTHGREGLGRLILGSVAERVTRLARVPVMLLRFDGPLNLSGIFPTRILVPLDGGPAGELALSHAIEIAKLVGADLELVHVVPDVLPMLEGLAPHMYDGASAETVNEKFAQEGRDILERAKVRAEGLRYRITLRHTTGNRISETILKIREEVRADLICMGTHGYGGFERLLLGSVAEGVAHHTTVPVLLLRPVLGETAQLVGATNTQQS